MLNQGGYEPGLMQRCLPGIGNWGIAALLKCSGEICTDTSDRVPWQSNSDNDPSGTTWTRSVTLEKAALFYARDIIIPHTVEAA